MRQYDGETYEYLKAEGYYQTSGGYGIVTRMDISRYDMMALFIEENFGETDSGLPSLPLKDQEDQYLRCYSKDKIGGVPRWIVKQLGTRR